MKSLGVYLFLIFVSTKLMADSAIVWSGQQDIKMGPGGSIDWLPAYGLWSLDMNADGINDMTFAYWPSFTVQPLNSTALVTSHPSPSVYDAIPIAAGTKVGAVLDTGPIWNGGKSYMVDWQNIPGVGDFGVGSWAFVTNGYLGVSFTAADGIHYGWVQITSYPDMRAHIHSWAYESQPGVSILAGAVPEPTTIELLLLGSGVVGLVAWRHRRRNAVHIDECSHIR